MYCPYCGSDESMVMDSRPGENDTIRRRRECASCHKRFTTYERVEIKPVMVIKRDGARELFDRNKIIQGLIKACEKRPVSVEQMEAIADRIESKATEERELPTRDIGETVMEELAALDQVSYVRFASVYRQFTDVESFMEEIKRMFERA